MTRDSSLAPLFYFGSLRAMLDWQRAVAESLLQAQRGQWEMLAAWQRSVGAAQQELRDQWFCRFGGGVPLDG